MKSLIMATRMGWAGIVTEANSLATLVIRPRRIES